MPEPGRGGRTFRRPDKVTVTAEGPLMAMKYTIGLPAPSAPDVATRELNVTLDGVTTTVALDLAATSHVLTVPIGTQVALFVVDVDGAGNRSAPGAPLTFTAADTVPPPAPAAPTVTNVEQEFPPVTPPTP